ncbi:hypothetical protein GCM10022381_16310 [Leifsonia kafniensis]|uniref:DUF2142 domain-containing protein n=1 Tax=Leifsonia kafniensis TaxID=475957 RepID=A0ABP7KFW7_9MICO
MTAPTLQADRGVRSSPRPSRIRVFGVSWLLLALLMIGWAVATPLAASPDEPAHMVKAASVARGQLVGEPSTQGHVVQVPRYVANTHNLTCFAFHPDTSADCSPAVVGNPAELVDGTTTAGLYNPVYYALVGWPTLLFADASGLYAMRIVSAILCSFFLALTVMLAFSWRVNTLALAGVAIAIPPMLFFLGGSVNPNAVETSATLAVFAAMLAIVTQPSKTLMVERSLIVLVGSAVAANTRGLSPLWVALAIGVPLMLTSAAQLRDLAKSTVVRWTALGTALTTAFAGFWLMVSNSLAAALTSSESSKHVPGTGASALSGFLSTVNDTFRYAQDMIGNFGWLDTPATPGTVFIWTALVGALFCATLIVLRGRDLAVSFTLGALFVLLPALIQGAYITGGGIIWQGRYSLPLFAMLIFGTAALLSERITNDLWPFFPRLSVLVWVAWGIGQLDSFTTSLKRYAVGAQGTWRELFLSPQWHPPGGVALSLVFFTLVTIACVLCLQRLTRHQVDLGSEERASALSIRGRIPSVGV